MMSQQFNQSSNYMADISPSAYEDAGPPGLGRMACQTGMYGSDQGSFGLPTPSGRRHDLPDTVRTFVRDSRNVGKDELRAILTQFEKTQLVEMLVAAAVSADDVKESLCNMVATSTTFRRLLVRNIPFQATSEGVKSMFANLFGPVEEGAVVYDRNTGRSKGFAFLTFESVISACNAVCSSLREEIVMDGRTVYLKFAADRLDHDALGLTGGGACSPISPSMVKLFVYNLSPVTTNDSLRAVFSQYGDLEECAVVFDPQGRSKRFAFVTFSSEEDAWRCLQEPNRTIDGRMTFTHLACEGRNKTTPRGSLSSASTGRLMTPRSQLIMTPTSQGEPANVFTPPSTSQGLLLGQEILSQWLNELSQESENSAERLIASAFSPLTRPPPGL